MREFRDDKAVKRPGFWTLGAVLLLYVALALWPALCHLQRAAGSV